MLPKHQLSWDSLLPAGVVSTPQGWVGGESRVPEEGSGGGMSCLGLVS